MNKLTNFQKIQLISSIIPYFSFYVITWITMIQLKKHKAKLEKWIIFFLIMFFACLLLGVIDTLFHFEVHRIFGTMVDTIVLGFGNFILIKLQATYNKSE